ncbi:MAG: N(G),N(G)-dimethylarginine dimethylaminohydrolase [FCB group bacterium]|nr:N(G),N(G)-dimethylarginine dimethylaminohydrolase [FCB group bacterium]MBL7026970.1 N(G),N(G)-dimethylarginine dimethylaminohydrolase [Candidatus Neomarinimicrobiota bacterium]MBL7122150.1 N(G),N(G)-dimethylarginine dimethylaminohydrolase [Candidatus Neomarinimicrobiota bacterium]
MFTKAIVRTPALSMINGLTSADLGKPDFDLALKQHAAYIRALESCGLEVTCLEANPEFPDSTFVEDVALLTKKCAIITNPGAPSRRGEIEGMQSVLQEHYENVEEIQSPGTLEAGDVMMVGEHFYIGLSARTNQLGADQLIACLQKYGHTGSVVELQEVLHLKTGVAYLEHNNLLACGEFLTHPDFLNFNILPIKQSESYAANCIWVNDRILVPHGYPQTLQTITAAGYEVLEVDVSEFRKLDGGLSCLSLRF